MELIEIQSASEKDTQVKRAWAEGALGDFLKSVLRRSHPGRASVRRLQRSARFLTPLHVFQRCPCDEEVHPHAPQRRNQTLKLGITSPAGRPLWPYQSCRREGRDGGVFAVSGSAASSLPTLPLRSTSQPQAPNAARTSQRVFILTATARRSIPSVCRSSSSVGRQRGRSWWRFRCSSLHTFP
jgi:hypothetical protein